MSRSTAGAAPPPKDMIIGECIAMLATAPIRNALPNQRRIARSSQAPAAAPSD
jgi:hypothetical protein